VLFRESRDMLVKKIIESYVPTTFKRNPHFAAMLAKAKIIEFGATGLA